MEQANHPEISIVIPCYNGATFLVETFEHLVNQSFKDFEVIFVDDGSKDDSIEIAQKYISQLNLQIVQQKNSGVSVARNHGFSFAKGKYIAFLDCDDLLTPKFLEEKRKLIQQDDCNCVGSKIVSFNDSKDNVLSISYSITKNISSNILNFVPNTTTVPSGYLFEKELFSTHPFNEKLSSTADRFLLIENEKNLKILLDEKDASELFYRFHSMSMSQKFDLKLVEDNRLFYEELKDKSLLNSSDLKKGRIMLLKSYLKIKEFRKAINQLLFIFNKK